MSIVPPVANGAVGSAWSVTLNAPCVVEHEIHVADVDRPRVVAFRVGTSNVRSPPAGCASGTTAADARVALGIVDEVTFGPSQAIAPTSIRASTGVVQSD